MMAYTSLRDAVSRWNLSMKKRLPNSGAPVPAKPRMATATSSK